MELAKFDPGFGKALVAAAKEKQQNRLQESVVGTVENLMQLISVTEERIGRHERNLQLFKSRLAAIEKGRFRIDQPANAGPQIVYHDAELNRAFESEATALSNSVHTSQSWCG